jgi:hypothetical protein
MRVTLLTRCAITVVMDRQMVVLATCYLNSAWTHALCMPGNPLVPPLGEVLAWPKAFPQIVRSGGGRACAERMG